MQNYTHVYVNYACAAPIMNWTQRAILRVRELKAQIN